MHIIYDAYLLSGGGRYEKAYGDVCARAEQKLRERCVCARLNKVWALFLGGGGKVAKWVCTGAKLATLCISISPTTVWATGQTENTCCVNTALIKLVPLKGICVNFDSTSIYMCI